MIIYLYGPDSYNRQKKGRFYLDQFKKKHSEARSIDHFSLDLNGDFERLKMFVSDQSLFGKGFKFATLHNVTAADFKEFKIVLEPIIEDKKTTIIVSEDKKLERKFHTFLSKAFLEESFDILKGKAFNKFLRKEAKERGVSLTELEENAILNLHEGDTWGAINQLEKLVLGGVTEEAFSSPEMFPLMFSLAGNTPLEKKLSALTWLLEREEPAKVFNIISALKRPELKKTMADYDTMIKSGKLEYEEALLDLTLK